MMANHLDLLIRQSLGTSARKEGTLVAVGEWLQQERRSHKKTTGAETSEEKERWHIDRLFGTNSLKKGPI
jgi:hypothetical protein